MNKETRLIIYIDKTKSVTHSRIQTQIDVTLENCVSAKRSQTVKVSYEEKVKVLY